MIFNFNLIMFLYLCLNVSAILFWFKGTKVMALQEKIHNGTFSFIQLSNLNFI